VEQLKQIQGIRTLAILGIFICHTKCYLADNIGFWDDVLAQLGATGVFTFFMISGFLFSYKNKPICIDQHTNPVKLAWKKVNKLYALYLFTFFIAFIAKITPPTNERWVTMVVASVFNLTLTQSFVPHIGIVNSFNGPAWFLSALFGIWIINYNCPQFVNFFIKERRVFHLVLLAMLILVTQTFVLKGISIMPLDNLPFKKDSYYTWLTYFNPIMCYSEFLMGTLLGKMCVKNQMPKQAANIIQILLLCFTCFYLWYRPLFSLLHVIPLVVVTECIVFVGILSTMSEYSIGKRLLSNRLMVFWGNISGYFFLIHGVVNFSIRAFCESYFGKPFLFFLSLCVSLILSVGTLLIYKKHLVTLKFV